MTNTRPNRSSSSSLRRWTDFFRDRPVGVNCQNGFVVFDRDGNVKLVEHHPGQKSPTICDGYYEPWPKLPVGSLLSKFFNVLPYNDPEQGEKHSLIRKCLVWRSPVSLLVYPNPRRSSCPAAAPTMARADCLTCWKDWYRVIRMSVRTSSTTRTL